MQLNEMHGARYEMTKKVSPALGKYETTPHDVPYVDADCTSFKQL